MAAEVALLVVQALDLRPHRAVEHQDALAGGRRQGAEDLGPVLAPFDHATRAVGEQGVDVLAHAVLRSVTCSYKDIVIWRKAARDSDGHVGEQSAHFTVR